MRRLAIITIAAIALWGCDNAEEFQHPENTKNPSSTNTSTTTTTTSSSATTTPATTTTTTGSSTSTSATATTSTPISIPNINPPPRDDSEPKSSTITINDTANGIIVVGGIEVDVTIGTPAQATLHVSENSMKFVKVEQKGPTISISTNPSFYAKTAKLELTMPELSSITTNGTALVKASGLQGSNVSISGAGSSTIEVSGTVNSLQVSSADSSYLKLKGLSTKTLAATSSDKSVTVCRASENATAASSGVSVIQIYGLPAAAVTKSSKDKSIVTVAPR